MNEIETNKLKQKTLNGNDISPRSRVNKKEDSEFQSYTYIKNELNALGWSTKNPLRFPDGQLYTQHECLKNPEIQLMLQKLTPEYVVKLNEDHFWVIEAKPTTEQIEIAYEEAVEYGKLINRHKFVRANVVSGVAGNDFDRYQVKTGFWDETKQEYSPVTYNDREITSLLSPSVAKTLIRQNSPKLKDLQINVEEYTKIAEEINEVLHQVSIKKDTRAGIVASILLSLLGETEPNYNDTPSIFVNDINSRAYEGLKKDKKEQFFEHIKIHLPDKEDAQIKFKEALVSAFFLLKKVNIKSAMRANSDILGEFYEVFLKYGNGAKDLGILLTPSHVTEFAADILDITFKDIIYDPTCGTGSFLVSAFHLVKKNFTEDQVDDFKRYRIFGIDLQPTVASLAIVNMLFRGDGKNNIINDNCFARALAPTITKGKASADFVSRDEGLALKSHPVTKVLMNPPFALEKDREYEFVDHALQQMEDGGLLFAILPMSVMCEIGCKTWREKLLKNNSLLAAVTFPTDLFYQASGNQQTVGVFVKKGITQNKDQQVLWIKATTDGYVIKKRKRLPSTDPSVPNDLASVKSLIKNYIKDPKMFIENKPELQTAKTIAFSPSDELFELIPEAYLDSKKQTIDSIKEKIQFKLREILSFLISEGLYPLNKLALVSQISYQPKQIRWVEKSLDELFDFEIGWYADNFNLKENKEDNTIPFFRPTSTIHNIIAGWISGLELTSEKIFPTMSLMVSTDGEGSHSFAYVTPMPFVPNANVYVFIPKQKMPLSLLLYFAVAITYERWRFSYARKPKGPRFTKLKVRVPVKEDDSIDNSAFEEIVASIPEYHIIKSYFDENQNKP